MKSQSSGSFRTKSNSLAPALQLVERISLKDQSVKSSKLSPAADLKSKAQLHALSILKNEERTAIRSRIEWLLTQQFVKKYGSRKADSDLNKNIKTKVAELVDKFDNIKGVESAVDLIELEVKDYVNTYKAQIMKLKALSNGTDADSSGDKVDKLKLTNANFSTNTTNIDSRQWPVINAIITLTAEEKVRQEEQEKKRAVNRYQEELTLQIEKNKLRKKEELVSEMKYHKAVQDSQSQYEQEMAEKKAALEEAFRSERLSKLQQIEDKKRLKEKERQYRIAIEQAEMARARRVALEEEEERRLEKERMKAAQDELKIENEKNKAMKLEALIRQQNYDKKLNADYEAKLEREELARQRAFQDRVDALAKFSNMHESSVASKVQRQNEDNDRKVAEGLAEAERQREQRDKRDFEQRRLAMKKSMEYNVSMIEHQRKLKEDEKLDAIERRRKMEQDLLESKRKEREQKEEHRIKMIELKHNLDLQIHQRDQGIKAFNGLSAVETVMNKSLIKRIEDDPRLMQQVLEKVNPHAVQTSRSARASSTSKNIFG